MAWTRDQILAVKDLPLKEVPVPAWGQGVTVWLRTMSVAERDRYILFVRKPETFEADPDHFRAKLLVFTLSDESGNRLFRDDEYELVGAKCSGAIDLLFEAAQRLNGLAGEAVEDARKNS
jgi:hypothetical protein